MMMERGCMARNRMLFAETRWRMEEGGVYWTKDNANKGGRCEWVALLEGTKPVSSCRRSDAFRRSKATHGPHHGGILRLFFLPLIHLIALKLDVSEIRRPTGYRTTSITLNRIGWAPARPGRAGRVLDDCVQISHRRPG